MICEGRLDIAMKHYSKPTVEVVELLISDNIAAIAPRTIYKKNGSAIENNTVAGDFFDYKTASIS